MLVWQIVGESPDRAISKVCFGFELSTDSIIKLICKNIWTFMTKGWKLKKGEVYNWWEKKTLTAGEYDWKLTNMTEENYEGQLMFPGIAEHVWGWVMWGTNRWITSLRSNFMPPVKLHKPPVHPSSSKLAPGLMLLYYCHPGSWLEYSGAPGGRRVARWAQYCLHKHFTSTRSLLKIAGQAGGLISSSKYLLKLLAMIINIFV